jgi:hypothetical protein
MACNRDIFTYLLAEHPFLVVLTELAVNSRAQEVRLVDSCIHDLTAVQSVLLTVELFYFLNNRTCISMVEASVSYCWRSWGS